MDQEREQETIVADRRQDDSSKEPAKGSQSSPAVVQAFRALLLTQLLAMPALICIYRRFVFDPDIWWHLRAGAWILQHRAFPHTDPFSSFGIGKPWAAYSWLFELAVLGLYNLWGLVGILAFNTVLVVAITAAVYHMVARLQPDFTKTLLLSLMAMLFMVGLYTPRPWLFTILFFVLEIDILMNARRTGKLRELLWLPVIFAVWANIHVQFVDGFVALGAAWMEAMLAGRFPGQQTRVSASKLLYVCVACVLAILLNPYGWQIYEIAYELASQPGVLYTVQELQSLQFREVADFGALFLALAAVGALAWKRRFPAFESSLLAAGTVLSFRSKRDVWFVIVIAVAVLASALPASQKRPRRLPLWAAPLMAAAVALVLGIGALIMKIDNPRLLAVVADQLPVRAVEVVNEKGYGGALFNNYVWGGFLIWNLPSKLVSIDGRAALHGDERINRLMATWSGKPSWTSDQDLASAGVVIAPREEGLTQLLRLDTRFERVYEDSVAVVFVARAQQAK